CRGPTDATPSPHNYLGQRDLVESRHGSSSLWCHSALDGAEAQSGANPDDVQANPVESGLSRQVERSTVVVAPGQVVRVLGTPERTEMPTFGRQDPEATGPRHVEVPSLIDLDSVQRVLTRCARHVEEDAPVHQAPVRPDLVPHDDFLLRIP